MKKLWKIILLSLAGFFVLLMIYLLSAALRAPKYYWSTIDAAINDDAKSKEVWDIPESAIAERSFLESRVKMMTADSTGLVINLADTLVWMELKGIAFNQVNITTFKVPRAFKKLGPSRIYQLFSSPLKVTERTSTISREPITVIQAPKDTVEAAQNVFIPDTTLTEQTIFAFNLSNGIKLVVTGWDETHPAMNRVRFKAGQHAKYLTALLRSGFRRNALPYHPVILLTIPSREAKVFYRALPIEANVIIKLPFE